jgi:hypothetical protein
MRVLRSTSKLPRPLPGFFVSETIVARDSREGCQERVRRDTGEASRHPAKAHYSEAEGSEGSGEAEGPVSTA